MGAHIMKTTVEISDALFEAAKRHANEQGTTLRALIEQGLRTVLKEGPNRGSFTLRDASVSGRGIRPEIREGGWERVAEMIYEGRGG